MHRTKKIQCNETKNASAAGEDRPVPANVDARALLSAATLLKQLAEDVNRRSAIDQRADPDRSHSAMGEGQKKISLAPAAATQAQSPSFAPDPNSSVVATKTASAGALRILVVEDEFTSRVVLQRLLARYGEIDVAVNGREAVDAFEQARSDGRRYDLICMDIRLPKIDGTEAVRQIRSIEEGDGIALPSRVKIFMTTAIRDLKTVNAAYKALCDTYLYKPIDGAQLQDHMRAFGLLEKTHAAA